MKIKTKEERNYGVARSGVTARPGRGRRPLAVNGGAPGVTPSRLHSHTVHLHVHRHLTPHTYTLTPRPLTSPPKTSVEADTCAPLPRAVQVDRKLLPNFSNWISSLRKRGAI